MIGTTIIAIVLIILIILSAFFSASEIVLFSLQDYNLMKLESKSFFGKYISKFRSMPDFFLVTILLYNNFVNIAASTIFGVLVTNILGNEGIGVATIIMTFLILTFGEIFPKSFGYKNNLRLAPLFSFLIYSLGVLAYPITKPYEVLLKKSVKINDGRKGPSEQDLKLIIHRIADEGILERQEERFVNRILDLDDKTVRRILIPKEKVIMLNSNIKVREALKIASKHGYSRYPVFKNNKNNIIGVLHIKDIFKSKLHKNKGIVDLLHDPLIISPNEKLNNLLELMKATSNHMAIVKIKSKFIGIVTLEDVIEEVFGEIRDEIKKKPKV